MYWDYINVDVAALWEHLVLWNMISLDWCKSVYKTSTSHDLYAAAHLIHMTSKTYNKITGDYAVIQSRMFVLQQQNEHIHWLFYTHTLLFVFIMGVVCREAIEKICQLTLHTHTHTLSQHARIAAHAWRELSVWCLCPHSWRSSVWSADRGGQQNETASCVTLSDVKALAHSNLIKHGEWK